MGLFDIFKEKPTTVGTLHGMDLREWNDGYKSDDKSIIKFVNNKLKSMSHEKFLNFLKKRELYRKFTDEEANEKMNKLSVTEPKGIYSLGLTKLSFVFYPIGHLNTNLDQALKDDSTSMTGFRIVDTDVTYEKKEMKFKKSKTLIILSVHNNQKWWAKKINYEKVMRSIGFQFVDLDKDEYELIKTFEKGFDSNSKSLATWVKFLDNDGAYGALFDTPKRKKYPINRFQSYLAFEE